MLDMFSDDIRRDPYPLYAQLRGTPLLHLPTPGLWLVSDHEGVKRALIDSDSFSSSVDLATGKTPDWLVFSDPPRHTRLRAILLRAFTPRSIAGLEPRVRELSRELLAPGLARGEFDLAVDYAGPLPTLVIAEMIGIPIADRPRFIRWTEAILGLSQAIVGGEAAALAIREHAAVKQEIADYLDAAIAARRDAPQDDLLGRLLAAEIDGERLSHAEIVGFVQFLLAAGTETTANVIANAFLELAEHPELRDRLRAAPELLPTAIEEFVRHRSPLQLAFR
jgi:cytochrome P450